MSSQWGGFNSSWWSVCLHQWVKDGCFSHRCPKDALCVCTRRKWSWLMWMDDIMWKPSAWHTKLKSSGCEVFRNHPPTNSQLRKCQLRWRGALPFRNSCVYSWQRLTDGRRQTIRLMFISQLMLKIDPTRRGNKADLRIRPLMTADINAAKSLTWHHILFISCCRGQSFTPSRWKWTSRHFCSPWPRTRNKEQIRKLKSLFHWCEREGWLLELRVWSCSEWKAKQEI